MPRFVDAATLPDFYKNILSHADGLANLLDMS